MSADALRCSEICGDGLPDVSRTAPASISSNSEPELYAETADLCASVSVNRTVAASAAVPRTVCPESRTASECPEAHTPSLFTVGSACGPSAGRAASERPEAHMTMPD